MKLKTLVQQIKRHDALAHKAEAWRAILGHYPNSDQRTASEVSSADAGDCTVVPDSVLAVIGAQAVSVHRIGLLAIRYHLTDLGRKREEAYAKLVHAVAVHGGKHP